VATADDALALLRHVLAQRLGIAEASIARDTTFRDDLLIDSLTAIEVLIEVEEHFGVVVPDEVAQSWVTVGDAVDFVASRA
jgi:acyl carrier protein